MAVKMELSRIFIREMTDMQIIELTEVDGERTFPIVIGLNEAFAIERRLKGLEIPRPQTHELLASVIGQLGGQLKEIVIHDLTDRTFYAKLIIIQDGLEIEIDSRPSDAIALGVAEGVPIYVAENVIAQTEADELLSLELNGEYEVDDEDYDDDDDDSEENWG
ncbi:MAG: bifunctional nuclease family protein [Planctomycetes bacterium]|nr:bifunctional nuclease family protein [Planctomycetota bacterium]MCH7603599.1 bifunctional nuclease family protein [Planctomycetota bacterium]